MKTVGYALCGSYCTFERSLAVVTALTSMGYSIVPIMSENAYSTDTRFGSAESWQTRLETLCGRAVIHTIAQAEPIGPKALLDALIVAPCTGNTLAKLASGVTDTCVTMACKAHLRNGRPLILCVSTNDALSASAHNIGKLMARKNVFFVPLEQDAPQSKPCSVVARMELIPETLLAALGGEQLQPMLL